MADDITNNKVFGFLSLENIGSLVLVAFLLGVGYNALAADNKATNKRVAAIEAKVENLATIQTDIAVIKISLLNLKENFDRQFPRP